MKKNIYVIILFIIFSNPLIAYELTLGDDLFGINLFTPIENAKTVNIYSTTPLLFGIDMDLDYTLYTNETTKIRVDETSLILSYPITGIELIDITPALGITISGDLSRDKLMDFNFKKYIYSSLLFSKKTVLYDSGINSGFFYSNVISELEIILNYIFSVNVGYALMFEANNVEIGLAYRYGYIYDFSSYKIINDFNDIFQEGVLNLSIGAGHFRYDLDLFLNGSFSRGKYSINFNTIPTGSQLLSMDMKIIPGSELDIGSNSYLNTLQMNFIPFNWEYSRLEIFLKSAYGWNEPGFKNSDLKEIFYNKTYYNKLILGINGTLFENYLVGWFFPYLGFGLGIENYNYITTTHIIPIYEWKLGFSIQLPQFFNQDNIQYGVDGNIVFRDSLNDIEFYNNILLNIGLLIAIEL